MRPYALRLTRWQLQLDLRSFHFRYAPPLGPSPLPRKNTTPAAPVPPKSLQQPIAHLWKWRSRSRPEPRKSIRHNMMIIGQLSRYRNDQIGRPPGNDELAAAFRGVVDAYEGSTLTDEYAYELLKVHEHVRVLPEDSMRRALAVVYRATIENQVLLGRRMFAALRDVGRVVDGDVVMFVHLLSRAGNSAEALGVAEEYSGKFEEVSNEKVVWEKVLDGFSAEGNEEGLLRTWERLGRSGVEMDYKLYMPLVKLYCERGELGKAKMWYGRIVESENGPTASAHVEILRACLSAGNWAWGNEIVDVLLEGKGNLFMGQEAWSVVLKWHLAVGAGPEKIDELLDVMVRRAEALDTLPVPDINTINSLLRSGMEVVGPDFPLDTFLSIADRRGFNHDRTTFELKLRYKVNQGNTEEALAAYEELKGEQIPREYHATEVKCLLQHLCTQTQSDKDSIHTIYTDLLDWDAPLDAQTLCPLLRTLLGDHTFGDVIALLTRATLNRHEKSRLISVMIAHISRETTSIEASWDTYQILYQVFPETTVDERTHLMKLFFDYGRSDMGVQIFQHMRQTRTRRPTKSTYLHAIIGVGVNRDLEALRVIHNALNLDAQFDPDTRLLNALMNAYVICGVPVRGMDLWDHIRKSRQGPDAESVAIALEACSRMPDGIALARILWGQLRSAGYCFSAGDYAAYIEALGRNGMWEDAFKIAKEMKGMDNVEPDVRLLGALYTTMIRKRKDEVAEWASTLYPDTWARVQERLKVLPGKQVDLALRDWQEGERRAEEKKRRLERELANLPGGREV